MADKAEILKRALTSPISVSFDEAGNPVINRNTDWSGVLKEPSFVDKLKSIYGRLANSDTALPMPAGIVMNEANAPKLLNAFKDQIAELEKYLGRPAGPYERAMEYFKLKYPKLSSLPYKFTQEDLPYDPVGIQEHGFTTGGELVQRGIDPNVRIPFKDPRFPVSNRLGSTVVINKNLQNPLAILNTLAHESTHALQYYRDANAFNNYIQSAVNMAAYEAQPTEVAARQAGATAVNTARKWGDILKSLGLIGAK